jgi:transcriptional regulator with XRE-family HTH domain
MADYTEYSAPELVKVLGIRFKDYRLRAQLTQKDVAELTGLTIPTIQRFENGLSANITLGTFLLLMKAVGCINGLDELMPEQPESPYLYNDNNKKAQRVRHKRNAL